MARINIENSLFQDQRFFDLAFKLGSKRLALGAVTEAFIVAQDYCLEDDDCLIPLKVWKQQKLATEIIEVGLAEKRENGVYVCGSKDQFEWLRQRSDAGKKSAEVRKQRKSTVVERPLTGGHGSQPLTLSLSLSQKKKNTRSLRERLVYPAKFLEAYEKYPRKKGKKASLVEYKKTVTTDEDHAALLVAIENFSREMVREEREETKIQYFSTFMSSWEDWIEIDKPIFPVEKGMNLDDMDNLTRQYNGNGVA